MEIVGIILLVMWFFTGVVTLIGEEVPKISYALTWIILMIQIADNYLIA